jgi:carboxypeptidase A2
LVKFRPKRFRKIDPREWISPAFCLYVIDRLLDPAESAMTDKFDYYIMPNTNPDGYVYTWGKNRWIIWVH